MSKDTDKKRQDGMANILTGLGDNSYDKRLTAYVAAPRVEDPTDWDNLYAGSDIAARVVETVPREMLRAGFCLQTEDKDLETWVLGKLDELGAAPRLVEGLSFANAYGGALLVLGVDDGQPDMGKPLNLDGIKAFKWLAVVDRYDVGIARRYADTTSPKYGLPEVYQLQGMSGADTMGVQSTLVHETRCIRFDGVLTSRRRQRDNLGWGDSVFVRLWDVVRDTLAVWDGAAHLVTDFAQAVYKIKGLGQMLIEDRDDEVLARVRIIDRARSVARMIPIDADGEDFTRTPTPMAGLHELLDRFMKRLSGATGIPVALLMGETPAGLNATGDSTIRFFYDSVAAQQVKVLTPVLNRLIQICLLTQDSPYKGAEPDDWQVVYNPLWQMTEKEQAELRKMTAEADAIDIANGVLDPAEVTQSRYGGAKYSIHTTLNLELRQGLDAAVSRGRVPAEEDTTPTGGEPQDGDKPAAE